MREFWVLVKKELKSIRREKTIMFAIVIQFFIASFSSILLVGVMSFYDPESIGENTQLNLKIGVIDEAGSPIVDFVESRRNVRVILFSSIGTAEEAFRSGRVDAVMSIPPPDGGVVNMKLVLPESDTESMLILMILDKPLKDAENHLRQLNGIDLHYAHLEGKSHTGYEFLYSVIIPVLMFFPALIAGSITIDTISEELQHKTLDTLWSAPLSLTKIFLSKVFTAGLAAFVQCVLWVLLIMLNSFSMENVPFVLLLATLIAFCVSFGSGIIALSFKDRERSQFVYSVSLVIVASLSYLFSPSPFELITRLSAGGHYVDITNVIAYFLPLVIMGGAFFLASRRLMVKAI